MFAGKQGDWCVVHRDFLLEKDADGTDAEPVHSLLQHMLADNFEVGSTEHATLVKSVIQAIKVGASSAASAGRISRVETASRM